MPSAAWRDAFFAQWPALAGGPLLTLPGRGTRLKGHVDAIRLLARLRAGDCDARLLLLGARETGRDGYLLELERLARTLGVQDQLAITAPRPDVRDVLAQSDLVLQLSSRPEAFGRTAAEALSLGRPVLGYAHGGVGEIAWSDLFNVIRDTPGVSLCPTASEIMLKLRRRNSDDTRFSTPGRSST